MTYHQQIKHPLWQKKRLEVLEYRNFECENCGGKEEELNVHHPFYKRGAMIWGYDKEELRCLCHICHKNEHVLDEQAKKLLSDVNVCKDEVIGYMKGMVDNPYTMLDSYEQVVGYLQYYGIDYGPIKMELMTGIKPFDVFKSCDPTDISRSIMRMVLENYEKILVEAFDIKNKRMAKL
jgi:hypothetical protein